MDKTNFLDNRRSKGKIKTLIVTLFQILPCQLFDQSIKNCLFKMNFKNIYEISHILKSKVTEEKKSRVV